MKCVGVDVFIHHKGMPKPPEKLGVFELKGIANRGTRVWPGKQPEIDLTDVFCCRYMGAGQPIEVIQAFEKAGFEWVHIEKLHELDGKPGFSVMQGE